MYDAITIGSATRDVFLKTAALETHDSAHSPTGVEACFPLGSKINIDELTFETGGGATNAAVTFARLGARTATVTAVGHDANGSEIAAILKRENITPAFLQRDPKNQTAYSIIVLAGSGERTILVYRGASERIDGKKIPWNRLRSRWFYVSSLGGNLRLMEKILAHAKKEKIRVAWNPGSKELKAGIARLEPLIRQTDIFNVNVEEAALLASMSARDIPALLARLAPLPRRAAIVTDGQRGAYAAEKDAAWHSGIIDVPRVNVTGAGDAFGSGVVAGLLKKEDLRYGLAVGTWNATGVVQQMGAKLGVIKKYPSAKAAARVQIKTISMPIL